MKALILRGQPMRLVLDEEDGEIVRVVLAPAEGAEGRCRRVLPGRMVADGDLAKRPPRGCWVETVIEAE